MRKPLDLVLMWAGVVLGGLVLIIVVVCGVAAGRYGDDAVRIPWTVGRVLAFCAFGLLTLGFLLKERRKRRIKADKGDASGG